MDGSPDQSDPAFLGIKKRENLFFAPDFFPEVARVG